MQIVQRIMEAHANVRNLSLLDAKMAYIKAWQSLPEFGITYFRIRMQNSKKEVRNFVMLGMIRIVQGFNVSF